MEGLERLPIASSPALTPETIALQALVDELFKRSDARAFELLNNLMEKEDE